jgi:uncharacterized protein (DUF362 family)
MRAIVCKFQDFTSIDRLLDQLHVSNILSEQEKIIIKPNLVTNKKYPVTTDLRTISELINYIKSHSNAQIIIAEGSADDTLGNFQQLGFFDIATKHGIDIYDLNNCDTITLRREDAYQLKEFHFPKVLMDSYIISVANLKEHIDANVSLTLKNMMGIAPAKYYRGTRKTWMKYSFHEMGLEKCLVDLIMYRKPDLGLIDGRLAQFGYQLGGGPIKEYGLLIGGEPILCDYIGSKYLGKNNVWYIEEIAKKFHINLESVEVKHI